jgi:cyclopropane fatty-acyl-phospholipid synthase-like methyltransferase
MAMDNPYDRIAEQWHDTRREETYVAHVLRYVDLTLRSLQPGAKVLDIGCGTGRPIAEYLVQKGFRVVCVDKSAKMLEIASTVVPIAQLIHADMLDIEFSEKFSAVIMWDSLFHVARVHHKRTFHKLRDWLEQDGRLLLSYGGSGHAGFTSKMHGEMFFYSGYKPEEMLNLLKEAGLEVELSEVDDASSKGHLAVVARKAENAVQM